MRGRTTWYWLLTFYSCLSEGFGGFRNELHDKEGNAQVHIVSIDQMELSAWGDAVKRWSVWAFQARVKTLCCILLNWFTVFHFVMTSCDDVLMDSNGKCAFKGQLLCNKVYCRLTQILSRQINNSRYCCPNTSMWILEIVDSHRAAAFLQN